MAGCGGDEAGDSDGRAEAAGGAGDGGSCDPAGGTVVFEVYPWAG